MAYDVIFDNVGSTAYPPQLSATFDANNFPDIFKQPFLANGGIYPGSVAAGGSLSQADARAATSSYIYDQKLPYAIQWNFGVQHSFWKDYTFEARYVGTRGVHLLVQEQINKVAKVTPDRYLPTYLQAPSQSTLDGLPWTLSQIKAFSNNPIYGPLGFLSNITALSAGRKLQLSWHGAAVEPALCPGIPDDRGVYLEPQYRRQHRHSLHDLLDAAPPAGLPEPARGPGVLELWTAGSG